MKLFHKTTTVCNKQIEPVATELKCRRSNNDVKKFETIAIRMSRFQL